MNHHVIQIVRDLKPGQCISVDVRELEDIPSFEHNGATFTAADRVLENIIGSAYEYRYWRSNYDRSITFERLPQPLTDPTAYVSPDRRP